MIMNISKSVFGTFNGERVYGILVFWVAATLELGLNKNVMKNVTFWKRNRMYLRLIL